MKRIFVGLLLVMGLSSCNTFIGMGRDMRQLGEGMENAANRKNGGNDQQGNAEGENLPTY